MEPRSAKPICPRCGYDQSGEVARWEVMCPTRGTCPECGTGFQWAEVFDPSRHGIPWFVEHADSVRAMAARTGPTLWRMAAPWVFWSRVPVQRATSPGRVFGWLLLLTAICHAASWLPVAAFLAGGSRSMSYGWSGLATVVRESPPAQIGVDLVNGLIWPFHYWTMLGYTMTADLSIVVALFIPLWIGVCWSLLLTILPTTRRLARLRPAHFVRALAIQAGVLVLAGTVLRVIYAASEHFFFHFADTVTLWVWLGLFVWSLAWWTCALRIGWGIRSWPLIVLGHVIVFLSLFAIMMLVAGILQL